MTQIEFLSSYARSRTTDPVTSHMAERQMRESGAFARQRDAVLAAVRAHSGLTAMELSRESGLDYYLLMRRLNEVETLGHIRRGDRRPCRVTGRAATTWWKEE